MKNRAMLQSSLREILQSKTRFLSILGIIFLGVAFFVGIGATGPDMLQTATDYYQRYQLADSEIISPYGLTQDDLTLIESDENVGAVEGRKFVDLNLAEKNEVVRFYGYNEEQEINRYNIISGHLPEGSDEVALDNRANITGEYKLGDTYTIAQADDENDSLSSYEYTVVGFVNSPTFVENVSRGNTTVGTGSIDYFAVMPEENLTADIYSSIVVRYRDLADLTAYSEEYVDKLEDNERQLEELLKDRPEDRLTEIKDEAQVEIDKAKQEVADGEAALAEAEQQLADSKAQLDDAQQQINDAQNELNTQISNAQAEIASQEGQLNTGQNELDQQAQNLATQKANLLANAQQVETAKAALPTLAEQRAQASAGLTEINNSLAGIEGVYNQMSAASQASDEEFAVIAPQLAAQLAGVAGQLPAEVSGALQAFIAEPTRENLQVGVHALGSMMSQLQAQQQEIQGGIDEIDSNVSQINSQIQQYENGLAQIRSGEDQIAAAQQQINNGRQQITDGRNQLNQSQAEGQAQIDASQAELDEGLTAYQDGLTEYQNELAEQQPKLDDAKQEISDKEAELNELTPEEYIYSNRENNPGYSEYEDNANRISSLATVFPIIFFLIAALVSLTTMTRMVEEKRLEIGTFKALGYGNAAIAMKFILYSALAGIIGAVAGLALGFYLFPQIIFTAYGQLYNIDEFTSPWHLNYVVIAVIVALLCTVGTALIVLRIDLISSPAALMRPKAPKAGQRILLERVTPIWSRLKFIQKVTMRNLFRYKQRMLMTILGIAGCMSMIITGFGLRDSISDIVTRQFDKVWHYSGIVTFNSNVSAEDLKEYDTQLADFSNYKDNLLISSETLQLEKSGETTRDVSVYVPENVEQVSDFILFNDRESGKEYTLDDSGAIINEKLADLYDLESGDTFTLVDSDQKSYELEISAVVENYTGHFAYMTPSYHEEIFDRAPEYNTDFLLFDEEPSEEEETDIANVLMESEDVVNVSFLSQSRSALDGTIGSLNIVVWVLIVSAGLLAFIVLYNLTNINVSERIRELSTIKVLGFYNKELTMYVYRENILLTFIGIAFGLLLGKVEHAYVLQTVEVDLIMFSPDIHYLSYFYASLITLLFTIIVGVVMHFKLRKVNMIEALKSNE